MLIMHLNLCLYLLLFFFFFKQKTAYEMLSGDWSSDVCSSDLVPSKPRPIRGVPRSGARRGGRGADARSQRLPAALPPRRLGRAATDVLPVAACTGRGAPGAAERTRPRV